MKSFGVCFILLSVFICSISCQNANGAGVQIYFPDSSLNYMMQQVMPLIQHELASLTIPDINGRTGTPIGDIDYSLSQIHLNNLQFNTPSIVVSGVDQLTINIDSASTNVNLRWHYREKAWPHISDGGSADCAISMSLSVSAGVVIDPAQKSTLKFSVRGFRVNINRFNIDLHGGASWLYQIFVNLFSGQIKSAVQSALNDNVPQAITEEVQHQLDTLDLQVPIANKEYGIFINFNFKTIAFNTTNQFLVLGAAGEFIKKGITPFPGEPVNLPSKLASNNMIQVFVTDYVVSSAGYAFHEAGVFNQVITWQDVPSGFPIKLNTKSFQYLVPPLYKAYPDMNMNLVLASAKPPTATINPKVGAEADADVYVTFQVIQQDGSTADAFTIELDLLLDMTAAISSAQVLTATVSFKNASLSLKSSNIGAVDISTLGGTVKLIIQYGVLPLVNAVTQKGFPIVSGDFQLVNPQIVFEYGYVAVCSDFTFKPSLY
jgi:lipopolysaccharide-binding protein